MSSDPAYLLSILNVSCERLMDENVLIHPIKKKLIHFLHNWFVESHEFPYFTDI